MYSDIFSPPKLKELFARHNITPKKSLGQNFLFDRNITDKIITAADITKDDTVVEIGAGCGVLTYPLALRARRVIAYEIDKRLVPILKEVASDCENVEIRNEDIRNFQFSIFKKNPNSKFKVVGNLPYYIASRILRQFLGAEDKPKRMVITVQKEVGARMAAKPPAMSLLSVMIQFYGEPKIIAPVSRNCFLPSPKVDSLVVAIEAGGEQSVQVNEDIFFALVKAGFAKKRKLLASNLAGVTLSDKRKLSKGDFEVLFQSVEIPKMSRAQELSVDEWKRLAHALEYVFR